MLALKMFIYNHGVWFVVGGFIVYFIFGIVAGTYQIRYEAATRGLNDPVAFLFDLFETRRKYPRIRGYQTDPKFARLRRRARISIAIAIVYFLLFSIASGIIDS